MKRKIKRVTIENFQSHKFSEIELDDFTVIIGPTDSGKSAIIRAIRWCLYNDVDNTGFIREGEKFAEVMVEFDNGRKIIRHRGSDENSYRLVSREGDVKLTAFGAGPVAEVLKFHGMYEANLFGDPQNLNVASQLEPPFFLAESAARKAVMIGQIANTDVIDVAIEKSAQDIRTEKAKDKTLKGELKKVNNDLQNYTNLPLLRTELTNIEESLAELENLSGKIDTAQKISSTINSLEEIRKNCIKTIRHEDDVNKVIREIQDTELLSGNMKPMKNYLSALTTNLSKNRDLNGIIKTIDLEKVNFTLDELQNLSDSLNILRNLRGKLQVLLKLLAERNSAIKSMGLEAEVNEVNGELENCLNKIRETKPIRDLVTNATNQNTRLTKGSQMINSLNADYESAMNGYKEALSKNPVCPVCQSQMTPSKIANISI